MNLPDTSSAKPLYKQLEDALKEAILSGEYQPGQQIPTENDLSASWQVSRVTVRKALDALTRENFLTRVSGKGTFVSGEKFQRSMTGIMSFSELCRSQGRRPGSRTIKSVFETCDEDTGARLNIPVGEKAVVIERIRYADDVPVSLETVWFPPQLAMLLNEDLNSNSLYDTLRDKLGLWFTHSSKTIELVYASFEVAHYLGVANRYPLISIKSEMIDNKGEMSCISHQLIVGDKLRFTV
ncbi:GntR family transcriptional regulator [Raoultella ornithinolytica]|uniref:GntR family transcriptional regulator n=1 Tax=Raoultella ornithinolytica TaxID=54291 RepID=A0ABD7QLQ1_RAOOR|nr:GntR family transcriptional regulator [Raoultella terrigena]ROS02363.1 GntR family transcriptional regulator [Raoultella terrigena]TCQ75104.1 GntR family transcriptional regulator [Raoultella ornithinolytica]